MLSLEWTFPTAPVGRTAEAGTLFTQLTNEPLVTLVGSRGSGKTTLARLVLERFPGHVVVGLRGIASAEGVRARIAAALGIIVARDEELAYFLRRNPTVLLLDHLDVALEAETERLRTLIALLAAVPFVRILVTARRPLGVGVENVVRIAPLGDVAPRLLPGYVSPDVARRLLLGHPLALRLAAPLILIDGETLWNCLEMALEHPGIDREEAVLSALSGLAARHLGYVDPEAAGLQVVLEGLPAGASQADLEALCGPLWPDPVGTLEQLSLAAWEGERLVLQASSGRQRRAPAVGPLADALEKHLVALARRLHEQIGGYGARAALAEFVAIAPNLIRSADSRSAPAQPLGVYVPRLLAHVGCRIDAELMARHAMERAQAAGNIWAEGWSTLTLGDLALAWGDWDDASLKYERANARFEAIGDSQGIWNVLIAQGELAVRLGQEDTAVSAFAGALQTATRLDDLKGQAEALRGLGKASRRRGEPRAVREAYEYSRTLFDQAGDARGMAACALGIGEVALREGKLEAAFDAFVTALDIHRAGGGRAETATVLLRLGEIVQRSGDPMRATMVIDEGLGLFRGIGDVSGEIDALLAQRRTLVALEMVEAAFAALHLAREACRAIGHPLAARLNALFDEAAQQLSSGSAPIFFSNLIGDAEQIRFNGVEEARTVLRLQDKVG